MVLLVIKWRLKKKVSESVDFCSGMAVVRAVIMARRE